MRKVQAASAFLVAALITPACGGVGVRTCASLGLCETDPPPPVQVTILCDGSAGSTCTQESLKATASRVLQSVIKIPGSRIDVWTLREDVASTNLVAQVEVAAPKQTGARAVETEHQRQVQDALYSITHAAQSYFDGARPRRSPLLGALGKISLTTERLPGGWNVVVVSDGLDFGDGLDFECTPPEDPQVFTKQVMKSEILTPKALSGADVIFAYQTLAPIDGNRCSVQVGRVRALRTLWTTLLKASGAHQVAFEAGAPSNLRAAETITVTQDGGGD